jgi:Ca2+-binding RTX toxin-like protein
MTRFFATAVADTFSNDHFLDQYWENAGAGQNSVMVLNTYDDFTFDYVDYSHSTSAVFIDTQKSVQHGGYAEGDKLTNIGHIVGSGFNDIIRGSDAFVSTHDGVLNDPGNNHLEGMGGDDILEGRGGADTLDGGAGNDTASYESSPTGVYATVNDPTTGAFGAYGGDASGDTLISIENLTGSAFDDILYGASNDNYFIGGLGNDLIEGDGGIDTVDYSTENIDHVGINLGVSGATEFKAATAADSLGFLSADHLYHIENIIGTSGDDQIVGSSVANVLDGGHGNDFIDGAGGIDTASFLSWDPASSSPFALQSASIVLGDATHDGSTSLSVYSIITHSFQLVEHDTLRSIENVTGSNLIESITGNNLANIIDGRGGNDTIDGGGGNDTLDGGSGVNTVSFASRTGPGAAGELDSVDLGRHGGDGNAQITMQNGSVHTITETDTLRNFTNVIGSDHKDFIGGNEVDNVIHGGGGDDVLNGFEGNDTLIGDAGADRLIGSTDADTLTGGAGNDTFLFFGASDSQPGAGLFDVITDFQQGSDVLDFTNMDANHPILGQQTLIFDEGSDPLAVGHIHGVYDAARNVTVVEANTAGPLHAPDFHLELTGHFNLTAADFHLV